MTSKTYIVRMALVFEAELPVSAESEQEAIEIASKLPYQYWKQISKTLTADGETNEQHVRG